MNTIRSTWIGWGTLSLAGAGAYYFAKRSIDAEKKEKFEAQQRRRQLAASFETQSMHSTSSKAKATGKSHAGDKIAPDEAADALAKDAEGKMKKRSKYEPAEVYRTRKGDRFS